MLACAYPALDRPMILFQNIVEILHRSMQAILLQSVLGFEPHDGRCALQAVGFGCRVLSTLPRALQPRPRSPDNAWSQIHPPLNAKAAQANARDGFRLVGGVKAPAPFGHASILCKAELLRQLKGLIERRKRNPF